MTILIGGVRQMLIDCPTVGMTTIALNVTATSDCQGHAVPPSPTWDSTAFSFPVDANRAHINQRLVDAVIADAASRGFSVTGNDIIFTPFERG